MLVIRCTQISICITDPLLFSVYDYNYCNATMNLSFIVERGCKINAYAPVKVNPDPLPPVLGYRWGLVLDGVQKLENVPPCRAELG